MDSIPTTGNRVRRSTAGINKRYDEQDYLLVSFPGLKKHSVVPAVSVNVDPLDKRNGNIKTYGSTKNLRIIDTGSKEVMKERASRYSASAHSEEIELVPDQQEEDDVDDDDDEYLSSYKHRTIKETKKRDMTNEQSMSEIDIVSSDINNQRTTTSNYEYSQSTPLSKKKPLGGREMNFDRVYSSKSGTKRSLDESSLSGSDETENEYDENLPVTKKSNELQSLFKKSRRKGKKQGVESVQNVNAECADCIKNKEKIQQHGKRLDALEKIVPILRKYRSKKNTVQTTETNSNTDADEIFTNIKNVTGVNPNDIRSTPTRPTMIMRELIKKSGHIGDKSYIIEHEKLFKEFVQVKCIILDDNLQTVWNEVTDSLSRQHLDEESNKKKKIKQDSLLVTENSTPSMPTQNLTTDHEQETIASSTTTMVPSESF